MNTLKKISCGLLVVFVGLFVAHNAFAADLHFTEDTTISIGSATYTILSESLATSMVVGSTTLTVTVPSAAVFTLVSYDGYELADDSSTISAVCTKADNRIVIDEAATVVITPDATTECAPVASSGGGGSSRTREKITETIAITQDATSGTQPSLTVTATRPGSAGASVIAWQQALTNSGYDPGPVDGKWGPRTEAAVRAFQAANGLTVDGWPGATTAAAMNGTATQTQTQTQTQTSTGGSVSATRPGTNGSATSAWQTALTNAGYDPGPIDGLWGPRTQAAVRAFQSANGLTVDGWPGPNTAAAMNSL